MKPLETHITPAVLLAVPRHDIAPVVTPFATEREARMRAELEHLLRSWQSPTAAVRPADDPTQREVDAVITEARHALARGISPYQVGLLIVVPFFYGPDDGEFEVSDS